MQLSDRANSGTNMRTRIAASVVVLCVMGGMPLAVPADATTSPPLTKDHPDFANMANMGLAGNAGTAGGVAQLTDGDSYQTGAQLSQQALDAGTFIGVFYRDGKGGMLCTTGFGAHDSTTGIKYILGAKHCANNKKSDSRGNGELARWSPLKITFFNPVEGRSAGNLAAAITCGKKSTLTCIVPARNGQSGDFFAWRPDSAIPSNRVQTGASPIPLPVLGFEPPSALVPGRTEVCHYGASSAAHGRAEQCGKILTDAQRKKLCRKFDCSGGEVYAAMPAEEGDSGGPVYEYNGTRTGVIAVGIHTLGDTWCVKKKCTRISGFYPIGQALTRLHLTLNTRPPVHTL
jgi:hypothetical protein